MQKTQFGITKYVLDTKTKIIILEGSKSVYLVSTHQSTTAKENHEDNEGLKPVVFNYSEACSSQVPPLFSSPFFYTDLTTLESLYTTCKYNVQTGVDKIILLHSWPQMACPDFIS